MMIFWPLRCQLLKSLIVFPLFVLSGLPQSSAARWFLAKTVVEPKVFLTFLEPG